MGGLALLPHELALRQLGARDPSLAGKVGLNKSFSQAPSHPATLQSKPHGTPRIVTKDASTEPAVQHRILTATGSSFSNPL